MAQLVEHHLAKVRVAGSNPVVRSKKSPGQGGVQGRNPPFVAPLRSPCTTFAPHFLPVFGRRALDPFILCVRVISPIAPRGRLSKGLRATWAAEAAVG